MENFKEILIILLLGVSFYLFFQLHSLFKKDNGEEKSDNKRLNEERVSSEIQEFLKKRDEAISKAEADLQADILLRAETKKREEKLKKIEEARQQLEKTRKQEKARKLAKIQKQKEALQRAEKIKKQLEEAQRQAAETKKQAELHKQEEERLKAKTKKLVEVQKQVEEAQNQAQEAEPIDVKSQYRLATKYSFSQNYEKAVYWYRKVAEQGYAEAQYNLGFMYEFGYGVKKDYLEAVKWYRKAAMQKNTWSQERLQELGESWSSRQYLLF